MRVGERVAEGHADARHVPVGERARARELGHRPARYELGHQVDRLLVLPQLVQGDDPRVVQPRRHPRLARRAVRDGVAAVGLDDLDRDLALELLVEGQPDHAEPAGAELALEPVAAQHQSPAGRARGLPRERVRRVAMRVGLRPQTGGRILGQARFLCGHKTFHCRFRVRGGGAATSPLGAPARRAAEAPVILDQ
jgi:hypothetical protein